MKSKRVPTNLIVVVLLLTVSIAVAFAQDRYTLRCRIGSCSLSSRDTRAGSSSPSVRTETILLRSLLIQR